MRKTVLLITALIISTPVSATRYWPTTPLTDWELYLNNGVAYVLSSQMVSHCQLSRAQINMPGTEYDKSLYAYALSAKARNKTIKYVVDDTQTICIVSALREVI